MENHIKAFKRHLAADRTSCHTASANQMRLFLHAGAYWILWTLRAAMPRRSSWRGGQVGKVRVRGGPPLLWGGGLKKQGWLAIPAPNTDQALLPPGARRPPPPVSWNK